jgi:hypothetical protein
VIERTLRVRIKLCKDHSIKGCARLAAQIGGLEKKSCQADLLETGNSRTRPALMVISSHLPNRESRTTEIAVTPTDRWLLQLLVDSDGFLREKTSDLGNRRGCDRKTIERSRNSLQSAGVVMVDRGARNKPSAMFLLHALELEESTSGVSESLTPDVEPEQPQGRDVRPRRELPRVRVPRVHRLGVLKDLPNADNPDDDDLSSALVEFLTPDPLGVSVPGQRGCDVPTGSRFRTVADDDRQRVADDDLMAEIGRHPEWANRSFTRGCFAHWRRCGRISDKQRAVFVRWLISSMYAPRAS